MILYRPIGKAERQLVIDSKYQCFPPRLEEQPIFYPVLNERYAEEIASKWNVKDKSSGNKGYITKFEVDDVYISQFQIQTVGASYHQEFWIPAEELGNFNNHIIGIIEIIKSYE
ncbi:MAG: hypothetical protein C0410_06455 [Anaerolinea sp.]|nr:hypothetical protein [Anaerolinea sp.]